MRNFEIPGRSETFGVKGMIAASHPYASQAGLDVLKAGGNAVDAAIAAAAALAVVEPTQTGIGGDCFVMLKRRGEPIVALNGAGWAPAAISAQRLQSQGITAIDPSSAAAVTVPGAIRTWDRLAQDHGTLPLSRLLAPAIAAAADGWPVAERLARDWARQTAKLSQDADTAAVFLQAGSGAPYAAGDLHRQPALARTLRSIATDGPDVFYDGWVRDDILRKLQSIGGVHCEDDFSAWQPEYVTPISVPYRGYRLWECPPSGQGVIALAMATMLERFDLSKMAPLSAERFHLQAEVARLAYAERDHFLCDAGPAAAEALVAHLLAPEETTRRVSLIRMDKRLTDVTPAYSPAHRDTVFISVVDKDGMAVSFINSIFDDFGSGIVAPESGVLLHNRGCGFVADPSHPNAIAGRKRPMHTIIPAILTKDDEAVLAFGVTGAHFQPLGQIQVMTNLIDHGMGVQAAIDHPRMFAHGDTLDLESSVPEDVFQALERLGHRPARTRSPLGTAQAIWIDHKRNLLRGGADPRRDGIALGY